MKCDDVQSQLSAWIDGEREIGPDAPAEIEAHLANCPSCRAAADERRRQHAELRDAFAPRRAAAAVVARNVSQALSTDSRLPQVAPVSRRLGRWLSLILAAACGFLLATIVFRPWEHVQQAAVSPVEPSPPALAQLMVATGEVEVWNPGAGNWSRVPATTFDCAPGAAVRTPAGNLCEFQTRNGCLIRLNDQTELTFRAADVVALRKGEIWCSVPQGAALEVLAEEPKSAEKPRDEADSTPSDTLPKFTCPSGSNLLTSCDAGAVSVTSAVGDVGVETKSGRQQLKAGQAARIVDGNLAGSVNPGDPLLEARWMQPLLIRKGHDDRELARRVNDLLAQVGRAKLSYLYEREIRSLGEYCVLPLIRYVESAGSRSEPGRRSEAMRIVADLAPAWAVRDLIDLLGDDDAEMRYQAAAALKRLTAQTQGREPDGWRSDPAECGEALKLWHAWWEQNAGRFPARESAAKM